MNTSQTGTSILPYNGTEITFELANGDVMVNLTEMGKAFDKRPIDFLRLPSTDELIKACVRKSHTSESQVVTTRMGSTQNGGGTWGNRLVALAFAQWLSVDFHLVCLEKIDELLTKGYTKLDSISKRDLAAMLLESEDEKDRLRKRNEEQGMRVQMLEGRVEVQQEHIRVLEPKAEYTDEVLQSPNTYTFTQMAKELDFRTVAHLTAYLKKKGIIFRQSGRWMTTADHSGKGYTKTRTVAFDHSDGRPDTTVYTVWTEPGRAFLHRICNAHKLEVAI